MPELYKVKVKARMIRVVWATGRGAFIQVARPFVDLNTYERERVLAAYNRAPRYSAHWNAIHEYIVRGQIFTGRAVQRATPDMTAAVQR